MLTGGLDLSFDGSLLGAEGEVPIASTGTAFVPGLTDQAVHCGSPGYLRYGTAGNICAIEGTVEFWVKPDWNGNLGQGHVFFQVGYSFNNSTLLAIDGANNLRFIQWGDDPTTPTVETDRERGVGTSGANWSAGTWYYVAAVWNGNAGTASYYVDGQLAGTITNAVRINSFSTAYLSIGSDIGGNQPAQAAFDRFRISERALGAGEILDSYYAGLGLNLLNAPYGLAVDSAGRTVVSESGGNRLTVFDSAGGKLCSFGGVGSDCGRFDLPWDIAVDAADRLLVVDKGNNRIQRLDIAGDFQMQFGSAGTEVGQFQSPEGIGLDRSTGDIYVADTANHRVQRFLADGSVDPTWGSGGIVGTTATVRRDHAGFDRPTDVAVHPVSGNVYVADFGNDRLEVFDPSGQYLRTYLAVYRPRSLVFGAQGNLYIAGDDPNDGYRAYDGRLRLLKSGDELIGAHYTGGLDDIGRVEGGVAIRPDGDIVFTDTLNGRLVRTTTSLAEPITDLRITGLGTSAVFQWKTARPGPSAVRYGATATYGTQVLDPTLSTEHAVTVTGLTPNTRLYYGVSFPDSFDGTQRWTPDDLLNTGVMPGATQFLRLKAAGLIYTDVNPGPGCVRMPSADLDGARARFGTLADFYWRNSGFKLWPDIQIIEIDRDVTGDFSVWSAAESDLNALGYSAADDFDAVWAASPLFGGNFGGGGHLFGRFVGMCQLTTQADFVAIHEVNHTIDSIYHANGLQKYEFNHGIWAIPGGVGGDFSINGQILRNMLPVNYTATMPPFTKILVAPDADNDGVPDSSPPGLLQPLSITEATLGTSPARADTDEDGLSDQEEATALPTAGVNPNSSDTDGDGIHDGQDMNPAYAMTDSVRKDSPRVDGAIGFDEGWTVLTDRWGYSNQGFVDDNNTYQDRVSTYAAWDDRYLYLALEGPPSTTTIRLDGSADNWFMGPDNYLLTVSNADDFVSVQVNVGVPDLLRQIDNDGQFSEFFDTNPQFSLPYRGRTIFDHPDDGLGFSGRLVQEADLVYRRGGVGDGSVWEIAIPWSNTTLLRGSAGTELALSMDVSGDRLFNSDHAARIRLDASPLTVESVVVNGGMVDPPDLPGTGPQPTSWAQQHSDLRTIVVTFSEDVQLTDPAVENSFRLTNLGVNAPADPDSDVSLLPHHVSVSGNVATLRFGRYELADGVYKLEIMPSVTDLAGNPLDGNGDGTGGDSYILVGDSTNEFYKLAGDFNGDGGVAILDVGTIRYWFAAPCPSAPEYADLNGDGGVSIFDMVRFRNNWLRHVTFPAMPAPPIVQVTPPADGFQGVQGQSRTFTFAASEPGGQGAPFAYRIDWGDGTPLQAVWSVEAISLSHTFVAAGSYTITATATDCDGLTGPPAALPWTIEIAEQQGTNVLIGGTIRTDMITVNRGTAAGVIGVQLSGRSFNFTVGPGGSAQILPQAGNDVVFVNATNGADIFMGIPGGLMVNNTRIQGSDMALWVANGRAGNNTLIGPVQNNFWLISGPNSGRLNSPVLFYSMTNLVGGSQEDDFRFKGASASVTGTITGAGGTDTLDYSLYPSAVHVDLRTGRATGARAVANMEIIVGTPLGDTLRAGANPAVLLGGGGNDFLYGGAGRGLLIGGSGEDTLYGGGEESILFGGATTYYSETTKTLNAATLGAILQTWNRTNLDHSARVSLLSTGANPLIARQRFANDAGATDLLYGKGGRDWFIAYPGD